MNKFYVTKDVAEKLRTKGYNVEEVHYENNCLCIDEVYQTDNLRIYKLPRIDEVLAWLRDEKKIHISIITYDYTWGYTVYDLDTFFPEEFSSFYSTYEAAVIAGIEDVIDNLI